ncbi:MAG: nucleotidyltransferase family protein, partial [Bacteroidales bacterium]|nr:nucleotidyltransferase family protein [Bacteroidales bacterium]
MLSREASSSGVVNDPGNLPQSEAEWQKWVTLGSNHYILPAVYARLSHNDAVRDYFPPELLQTLQSIYELNLKRNLNNMEQMTFLKNLFNREGIPHLFMKGSGHIVDELYASPGERMMLDIDLLVHPEHFLKAAA